MDLDATKERYDPHGYVSMLPKRHPSKPYTCGNRYLYFLLGFLENLDFR
jgi:hypothetical protein